MIRLPSPRAVVALALAAALAACSPLPAKRTSAQIYTAEPRIAVDEGWPQVTWQLVVVRPVASQLLDSNRIAVRPRPGQLQVYRDAVWVESAPNLVQNAILRGFEDSGRIVAVGRPGTGLRADYSLSLDLRRFETDYPADGGAPQVRVEIRARLLDAVSNQVLASRTFAAATPLSDTATPAAVAAFEPTLGQVAQDIVGWTLVTGEANAQSVMRRR